MKLLLGNPGSAAEETQHLKAINWFKTRAYEPGIVAYYRELAEHAKQAEPQPPRFTREWAYRNGLARPLT